jgi:cell division septation protein DedD
VPRNEDGEFELLLGNRQLMSVFFIVVILLGVFFAMGYIVGRNSSPVTAGEVASRPPETKSVTAAVPSSTPETAAPAAAAPTETASQQTETATQQGPATPPVAAAAPAKPSSGAAASSQPESGKTYLQISAVDHDKAEIYVELLRKKNFSAIAAEIPEKPGVFRVLVGPVPDAKIDKLRADLQNASFPGNIAVKKTF